MGTGVSAIDFAPLSRRASKAERKAVRSEARSGAFGKQTATMVKESTKTGILLTVFFGGFITLIIGITALVEWLKGEEDAYIGGLATAFVAAICVVIYFLGTLAGRRTWRRTVQLIAFARTNGFTVQPRTKTRKLPGVIFQHRARDSSTWNLVRWNQDGVQVESARHYWQYSGSDVNTNTVHYLAVHLDIAMPRMSFGCGRRIGNYLDMHFGIDILADDPSRPKHHRPKLICGRGLTCGPADRGRARALFTDELIALLTDDDNPANAEVAGDWFFAYYAGGVGKDELDEDWWRHKIAVADVVTKNCQVVATTKSSPVDGRRPSARSPK